MYKCKVEIAVKYALDGLAERTVPFPFIIKVLNSASARNVAIQLPFVRGNFRKKHLLGLPKSHKNHRNSLVQNTVSSISY